MKSILAGAVSALALLGAASASEKPTFDLYLSTDAAQSTLAVAGAADAAPFVVAGGATKTALDILADDAAALALADLKAKADIELPKVAELEIEKIEEAAKDKKKKAKKGETAEIEKQHKIILVKHAADETDAGAETKVERRIIKVEKLKKDGETVVAAETATETASEEAALEIGKEILIADQDELAQYAADGGQIMVIEKSENGAPVRLVKIAGASAASAASFIDQNKGLDDAEKAAMKSKLGL